MADKSDRPSGGFEEVGFEEVEPAPGAYTGQQVVPRPDPVVTRPDPRLLGALGLLPLAIVLIPFALGFESLDRAEPDRGAALGYYLTAAIIAAAIGSLLFVLTGHRRLQRLGPVALLALTFAIILARQAENYSNAGFFAVDNSGLAVVMMSLFWTFTFLSPITAGAIVWMVLVEQPPGGLRAGRVAASALAALLLGVAGAAFYLISTIDSQANSAAAANQTSAVWLLPALVIAASLRSR